MYNYKTTSSPPLCTRFNFLYFRVRARPWATPVSEVQAAGSVLVPLVGILRQTGPVRCRDPGHGHVGAVDEKDEDGEQTDHRAQHAEADDASTAQVQPLHDVAAQEGAAATCWYHHVPWVGERKPWTVSGANGQTLMKSAVDIHGPQEDERDLFSCYCTVWLWHLLDTFMTLSTHNISLSSGRHICWA